MKLFGTYRTHGAGTLGDNHVGDEVTLAGWVARRRDHGGVAFLDLRDASGVVQVVADPTESAALEAAHDVRSEYVLKVTGVVRKRPEGMENPTLATGMVEVAASAVEVLSRAETPPFPVEDRVDVDEVVRLTHRYVDLRREGPARALRTRAQVTSTIRRVMEEYGFIDVETPMLTRSTPEGARDFLVPSRMQPGTTYALPQSPQLFKQLLMVAGLERYYQIVKCFRDEDLRADRQPEFTQLDVEASFVTEEDIYRLFEALMATLWDEVLGAELPTPFPRIPYDEAMARFGSDRPDMRFGMELTDLNQAFADTEVGVFSGALSSGGSVVAVTVPGGGQMTRKEFDSWVDWAKGRGAKGLAWGVVEDGGMLRSPLAKFMSDDEVSALLQTTGAGVGDAIFFGAGETEFTRELMGMFRVAAADDRGLIPTDEWNFVWVVQWPMFEFAEGRWEAKHHPFTAPAPESEHTFHTDPANARARGYDLVLNGTELGGGSIRIHSADVQRRVFDTIGVGPQEAEDKFGFLLRGLSYGAPPHGGVAFGLDRLVMLLTGASSLREIIAFPKTASGADPLTGAPDTVDDTQWNELGLRRLPPPTKNSGS